MLEGLAANELHPQADLISNLLGAVDGDHVRMPHAREQSAFVDDRRRRPIAGGRTCGQELQRDFAIEPRIPGAVNLSERAPADPLDEPKMTPPHRRVRSRRLQAGRSDLRERGCTRRGSAMELGYGCEHPQLSNEWLLGPFSSIRQPSSRWGFRRGSRWRDRRPVDHSAARFISSANRTRARCAVLRAASGVGLPNASASFLEAEAHLHPGDDRFPLFHRQPLKRPLVALDRLTTDRLFEG